MKQLLPFITAFISCKGLLAQPVPLKPEVTLEAEGIPVYSIPKAAPIKLDTSILKVIIAQAQPVITQPPASSSSPLYTTLLTVIISAVVSSLVTIKLKDREYKNEYYKKVIDKRIAAYEHVEKQLVLMRATITPDDGRQYLYIFSRGEAYFNESMGHQFTAMINGLWLNNVTYNELSRLNKAYLKIKTDYDIKDSKQLVIAGQAYFEMFVNIRNRLEWFLRQDIRTLYDVENFFDTKR